MHIGQALREERERAGMTRAELGKRTMVSASAIAGYENGTRGVPPDFLQRAVKALRSPRLKRLICFNCGLDELDFPWLERADHHPVVSRDKVVEEFEVAARALRDLPLTNKLGPDDLSGDDWEAITKAMMLVARARLASMEFQGTLEVTYGYDPHKTREEFYQYLRGKRYLPYLADKVAG